MVSDFSCFLQKYFILLKPFCSGMYKVRMTNSSKNFLILKNFLEEKQYQQQKYKGKKLLESGKKCWGKIINLLE